MLIGSVECDESETLYVLRGGQAAGPLLEAKAGTSSAEKPKKTSDMVVMTKGQRKAKRLREAGQGTLAEPKRPKKVKKGKLKHG